MRGFVKPEYRNVKLGSLTKSQLKELSGAMARYWLQPQSEQQSRVFASKKKDIEERYNRQYLFHQIRSGGMHNPYAMLCEDKRTRVMANFQPSNVPANETDPFLVQDRSLYIEMVINSLFRKVPLGDGDSRYKVIDRDGAMIWEPTPPGTPPPLGSLSESSFVLEPIFSAGGYSYNINEFKGKRLADLEGATSRLRDAEMLYMMRTMFSVIEAIPSTNDVAYQDPTNPSMPSTDPLLPAYRVAETLREGVKVITNLQQDKLNLGGYGRIYPVLLAEEKVSVFQQALGLTLQAYSGSPLIVGNYSFTLVPTRELSDPNYAYLIIPGVNNVMIADNNVDLMEDMVVNIRQKEISGWTRSNVHADPNQIVRLALFDAP